MLTARFKLAESSPLMREPAGPIWRVLCGYRDEHGHPNCCGELGVTRRSDPGAGTDNQQEIWAVLLHRSLVQVAPGQWKVSRHAARSSLQLPRRTRRFPYAQAQDGVTRNKYGESIPVPSSPFAERIGDLWSGWTPALVSFSFSMQAAAAIGGSEALAVQCPRCYREQLVRPADAGKENTSTVVA